MQISWWVELIVRPGCLDEFETLTGEMVASTRAESGVLAYQRFISEDRQTVYVHERYENCDAAVAHLVKFAATFGERYGSLVTRKRFVVFGDGRVVTGTNPASGRSATERGVKLFDNLELR